MGLSIGVGVGPVRYSKPLRVGGGAPVPPVFWLVVLAVFGVCWLAEIITWYVVVPLLFVLLIVGLIRWFDSQDETRVP